MGFVSVLLAQPLLRFWLQNLPGYQVIYVHAEKEFDDVGEVIESFFQSMIPIIFPARGKILLFIYCS